MQILFKHIGAELFVSKKKKQVKFIISFSSFCIYISYLLITQTLKERNCSLSPHRPIFLHLSKEHTGLLL